MMIPPRNLYALLCYAWDVLERADDAPVGLEVAKAPVDLLASVLVRETDRLLKRGLARRYVEEVDDLRRPRGQIRVSETIARALLARRRVHCAFEELTPATLANGLLLGSLQRAARLDGLSTPTRTAVRRTLRRMPELPAIEPGARAFSRVPRDRLLAPYRLALNTAALLSACAVPRADQQGLHFDDFTRDEHRMGRLFQAFVRRFLARSQDRWRVEAPHLEFVHGGPDEQRHWAPRMETDITLTGRDPGLGAWVLELKCVNTTLQGHHGKKRVRSDHLYQLLTYLQTRAATESPARGGVLLYAESQEGPLRIDLDLNGNPLLVRTVPLGGSWEDVRGSLLDLSHELATRG